MSQKLLDEKSSKMLTEDEEEEEEEKQDKAADSWEARAEQLFNLCDRERKGFITKRDLQRLWGELPLGPDELEGVFDSLDQDQNSFLTLQEFTDGFGHHLGLVVEFRAECSSNNKGPEVIEEEEEIDEAAEEAKHDIIESGSISSQQLDNILSTFAKHDFDISSSVVESVWRDVCQVTEEDAAGGGGSSGLGRLVVALLQELSRVKVEQTHLEAALNSKTDQYNQQVTHLYEELESQISGERYKAVAEHNEKGARALASLEQEVRDRETTLRVLQEDHAALIERVESLTAADLASKQDNVRLMQHLSKVEEDLSLKEKEVLQLKDTVDHLKKNSKDEKRRRAQRAMKVSEGISLERESLVTQLDLLRTINTHLRDEHDQTQPTIMNASDKIRRTGNVKLETVNPPKAAERTSIKPSVEGASVVCDHDQSAVTSEPPHTLSSLSSSLQGSDVILKRVSPETTPPLIDLEYDELYFQNAKVSTSSVPVLPLLTTSPTETSLLHELLQQPSLCASCGGTLSHQSDTVDNHPRVAFKRQDSMTQTSPTTLLSKDEHLEDFTSGVREDASSPTRSPEGFTPAQICAENVEASSKISKNRMMSMEDPGNNPKILSDLDITQNCSCDRDSLPSPTTSNHSSTIILYHSAVSPAPDLLPQKHTNNTYIHTQHKHHSHTNLIVNQLQSQSTNTQSQHLQKQEESKDVEDGGHQKKQSAMNGVSCHVVNNSTEPEAKDTSNDVPNIDVNNSITNESIPNNQMEERRPSKSTSSSLIEQTYDKLSDLKNLKDNIKNYISDKSQLFMKESHQDAGNGDIDQVPITPVITSRVFKIVFIGDSCVGKTTFIHRASTGEYHGDFRSTVGVDYRLMKVCVGGVQALLQLWDTAGQERYRAITRQYYRKADGVVVMYDVTNERSFLNVSDWISSVREYADSNMVLAIIGNKKDLRDARQIHSNIAYKLSKAHNSLMYECSAATGCGVQEVMKHLAAILTTDQQHDIDTSATLTLHRSPKSRGKCC